MPHELSNDDIARSAAGMIRAYGDDAKRESSARARKFEKRGASDAARNWSAIVLAIGELRRNA
jgi:hypothetical protein